MSVLVRVECDLCGVGTQADARVDVERLRADEGLVDGSEFGVADAHPACLAEKRAGRDPVLLDGLPGLCEVTP